jgi:hypothetical protein
LNRIGEVCGVKRSCIRLIILAKYFHLIVLVKTATDQERRQRHNVHCCMKLLYGLLAYLAVVAAAVAVTAFAGLSAIGRLQPKEAPVLAMSAEDRAAKRERVLEEARTDPNRVPVWIVPTPKYEYTPVPIDAGPKHTPGVIGLDARGAMAKAGNGNGWRQERRKAATAPRESSARSPAASSRRDNDPFFRD